MYSQKIVALGPRQPPYPPRSLVNSGSGKGSGGSAILMKPCKQKATLLPCIKKAKLLPFLAKVVARGARPLPPTLGSPLGPSKVLAPLPTSEEKLQKLSTSRPPPTTAQQAGLHPDAPSPPPSVSDAGSPARKWARQSSSSSRASWGPCSDAKLDVKSEEQETEVLQVKLEEENLWFL